ncbi:hypothetical protein [Stenotrophomonas rhizophila]
MVSRLTAMLQEATSRDKVFADVLEQLENGDPLGAEFILLRAQVWNQYTLISDWKQVLAKTSTAPGARDWSVVDLHDAMRSTDSGLP